MLFMAVLGNDKSLKLYITTLSNLTDCLQLMRTEEDSEQDEDSDEEQVSETLYKAAEQDVKSFSFNSPYVVVLNHFL